MQIKPTLGGWQKSPSLTTYFTCKTMKNRHFQTQLVHMQNRQSPMEGNLAILIKITTAFTLDPAIPLMEIYSPDIPTTWTRLFIAAFSIIAKG